MKKIFKTIIIVLTLLSILFGLWFYNETKQNFAVNYRLDSVNAFTALKIKKILRNADQFQIIDSSKTTEYKNKYFIYSFVINQSFNYPGDNIGKMYVAGDEAGIVNINSDYYYVDPFDQLFDLLRKGWKIFIDENMDVAFGKLSINKYKYFAYDEAELYFMGVHGSVTIEDLSLPVDDKVDCSGTLEELYEQIGDDYYMTIQGEKYTYKFKKLSNRKSAFVFKCEYLSDESLTENVTVHLDSLKSE